MKSLGSILLPRGLHERLQVERWYVHEFIRHHAIPLMKPGVRVLDAGSGREQEQLLRAEYLATGARLETCDFCAGPGVDHVADVADLPFPDECYDIVVCTQVLEHVQEPQRVVMELARVLKPGGALFLTTPQSSPLHNLPWNYFNFTNLGLRLLFQRADLTIIIEEPQGGHFALLAFNLHWTVREIKRRSFHPVFKIPLEIFSKAMFGFLLKVPLLCLDKLDRAPLNTLGWSLAASKPVKPQLIP